MNQLSEHADARARPPERVPLKVVAKDWTRIGVTGFGGPPTHIALLRRLVVEQRGWIPDGEFEAAIAACNLLPGPASTQLAIFCARRVAGWQGAVVAGLGFIVPSVVTVIALSALFLASSPPTWVTGAGAGAGAAVAAVAVSAGLALLGPSYARAIKREPRRVLGVALPLRWLAYALLGAGAAATVGPYLVLVLLGAGGIELGLRSRLGARLSSVAAPLLVAGAVASGGIGALSWLALKVGALSFGGGFVIVPLMRGDAVHTYHWMTSGQFLSGVAIGQVTPGPVVATVAAVGYAADGVGGAVLAAVIAFLPSFMFVLAGGGHFIRLRGDHRAQAFLDGAGPAAIGAIFGAAIPLAAALRETWQFVLLGAAAVMLLLLRIGVVPTLVATGVIGAIIGLAGGPLP